MFGFIKNKVPLPSTSQKRWDLHAHLLPAVDDGARTVEESLSSIAALKRIGYSGCVVTPHIYKDLYNNTREHLEIVFKQLKSVLEREGIEFDLRLAAEYFGDEQLIRLAEARHLLGFGATKHLHVLVEFPYVSEPLYWSDVLSALVRNGYQPVIAHPERYRYLAADPQTWIERFSAYDVKYQYDLGSLVGQYGKEAARAVRHLADQRLRCFWGTDLHRASQADRFIKPSVDKISNAGPLNAELDGLLERESLPQQSHQ